MRHPNGGRLIAPVATRDIEELSKRLVEWRRSHKPPTRIPEELWAKAAALAGQHGVAPMAKALRLDYAALRRRVQAPATRENSSATFLEWVAPSSGIIGDCSLEVESSRGTRLRVEMKNVAASGLATIIRDFAG